MKPTLLILAAGRGSRFGGAKQVAPMGPKGETIMEYSIYDALSSGFEKVVLVINKDVEQDTFELIEKLGDLKSKVEYAYQDLFTEVIPDELLEGRLKPWGTGHAVYSAIDQIDGAFAMINADDFYGKEAFEAMASFLTQNTKPSDFAMVGYDMINTLSENGTVSRGLSKSDQNSLLTSIVETHGIYEKDGKIYCEGKNGEELISEGVASMNFWGFQQSVFDEIKTGFQKFLKNAKDITKDEYYIPSVVDAMIHDGRATVTVLKTDAKWFGVTYKEDTETARASVTNEVNNGKYPNPLWK
ncbi:nucleotidyltransferase family protein [Reichenbachiella versicolor]|uniref:nucleotidyltransferase family protein n=1 Tax=Reichenbachiella versicolor TaxID=1821036 RepID=UPI000D6E2280|nr:sugar phosphate nucleotidyltransferase [Reichenbachiella versicolor]